MKKVNRNIVISVYNCELLLNESQSLFLSRSLRDVLTKKQILTKKDIKRIVYKIYENSHVRLFRQEDIESIVESIAKKISEEVGRNYASHLAGDSGNITKKKILSKNNNLNLDVGIDTVSQQSTINDDEEENYYEYSRFDDENDANIAINNFYIKNINKL